MGKKVTLTEEQFKNYIKNLREETDAETKAACEKIISRFSALQALDIVEQVLGKRERDMVYYALLDKYIRMWG